MGLLVMTDVNRDKRHNEIYDAGLGSDGGSWKYQCWECEDQASLLNLKDGGKQHGAGHSENKGLPSWLLSIVKGLRTYDLRCWGHQMEARVRGSWASSKLLAALLASGQWRHTGDLRPLMLYSKLVFLLLQDKVWEHHVHVSLYFPQVGLTPCVQFSGRQYLSEVLPSDSWSAAWLGPLSSNTFETRSSQKFLFHSETWLLSKIKWSSLNNWRERQ